MNNRRSFIQQSAAAASALAFPLVGGRPAEDGEGRHPAPGDGRAGLLAASSAAKAR